MIADVALDVGADVEKIKARQGRQHDRRRSDRRHDRQDRREHVAAPRRRAVGRARASIGSYVHNSVVRRPRQDRRAGRARIRRGKADELAALRPHGRDARRRRQSAGGRSVRARSGGGPAREGRAGRQVQGAGQARERDRQDRRIRAQDLLQGGLPARSGLHPRAGQERGAGGEGSRRQGRRADQGHRLRALRARRRHREAATPSEVASAATPIGRDRRPGPIARSRATDPKRTMAKPIYRRVDRQGVRRGAGGRRTASASISRRSNASPPISWPPHALGVALGVVVGGGNIFRGVEVSEQRHSARRPAT